jgi:cell division protein FtsN
MPDSPETPQATARSPLAGCTILIIALCVMVFLIGFSMWALFRQFDEIEKFTDSAAKPVEKPEANQRFVVQVAALASQEKVSELQNRLRAAGVSAHTRKSGELIRVQVGPFGSREEAEKARAKLGAQGFSGFLVPM